MDAEAARTDEMTERATLDVDEAAKLLGLSRNGTYAAVAADSDGCRPSFRFDVAHHSDLMSPTIPI
jgi:hypothetical protein